MICLIYNNILNLLFLIFKIKAICGEERIIMWHNHFKDLLGNPPEITFQLYQKLQIV